MLEVFLAFLHRAPVLLRQPSQKPDNIGGNPQAACDQQACIRPDVTKTNLKLKVSFGDVGSYAGLLVACGLGVTPDVVRFLGRLSEKNWGPVKERKEDLEQSVRDFVAKLRNVTALSCLLATRFYKLEPGLALNAVAGLKAIAEGRMELKEYTWPVLQLEGKKE